MRDAGQIARHYLVSGRVQGVYYRQSCREQALKLELRGWVRNLADGRVEAIAAGSDTALAAFEEWLRQGPSRAAVSEVLVEPAQAQTWKSFDVVA